jgi:3-methylcrotonyl-CoA carboxylase alpha subunit
LNGERKVATVNWSANGPTVRVDGQSAEVPDLPRHHRLGRLGGFIFGQEEHLYPDDTRVMPVADRVFVIRNGRQTEVRTFDPLDVDLDHLDGGGSVKAPMHGKVVQVFVEPGQQVAKGDRIAVIEAMKMEHTLVAPSDGTVTMVAVLAGEQVAEGAPVASIEATQEQAA